MSTDHVVDRILEAVTAAAPDIADGLWRHRGGEVDEENPTGDTAIEADVWADELLVDRIGAIDGVGAIASEERETAIEVGEGLSVTIDPLDGSSNLASNNSVGTIIGVYDTELPATGRELSAAMMVLYGPYTTMTVARDDRETVQEYLLRDGFSERWGEFSLPDEPKVIGLAGKKHARSEGFNELAKELEQHLKPRYGGATVADLAQVLEYGGLFGYPATTEYPEGKLRVYYEAAPLAYLVEEIGGRSTDGTKSLLDVEPEGLHARTPTFLGNGDLIDRVETHMGDSS